MPQIEEAQLRELEEAAGRVTTLEERATAAEARADLAEGRLTERDRTDRARALIGESDHTFSPLEERGLLADLPLTDDGQLDEATFTTQVNEAGAQSAAAQGVGTVTGFGGTATGPASVSESDIDNAVGAAFGRQVKEA